MDRYPILTGLIALSLLGPSSRASEQIVVRSGQVNGIPGSPGQLDDTIRDLSVPTCNTPVSTLPFTAADFMAASSGNSAVICNVIPQLPWPHSLPNDPLARWINASIGPTHGTTTAVSALYAVPFQVATLNASSATITLTWAVDDQLGDPVSPNPVGAYVNGLALDMEFSGGNGEHSQSCVPIHSGANVLYLYQRDSGCSDAGLMFSCTIDVDPPGACTDICAASIVSNGSFTDGLVPGSMPSGAVDDWTVLTATPQVVTDGCDAPGALQMWGNLVVGESVEQALPGVGIEAGRTYSVTVCYRWLDNNPMLPPFVGFRLCASNSDPSTYPPISAYDVIGSTPFTSSTSWVTYTFPDWTAPNDAGWITVNPENNSSIDDGNFVSWGQIDDICIAPVAGDTGTPTCFGDGSASACPCGNAGAAGQGCANGTGFGATLSASGTASVSNDTMTLTADGVINNNGLFFQGNNTIGGGAGISFGDGLRCCGGSVVRIQVVNPPGTTSPATAQMTETATTNGPAGTINAGTKKCYQFWYRDPASSPCGAQFNLTNAVTVTWGP